MRGLEGKRVIVTGGNSGIGAATVARFRDEGCEVFDLSRHPGEGGLVCDVGDIDQVEAALAGTGTPDVVVNNAGISFRHRLSRSRPASGTGSCDQPDRRRSTSPRQPAA